MVEKVLEQTSSLDVFEKEFDFPRSVIMLFYIISVGCKQFIMDGEMQYVFFGLEA
jgi:hypothetical protein